MFVELLSFIKSFPKTCIGMNTELRTKAKNDFEKVLMNNSVSEEAM